MKWFLAAFLFVWLQVAVCNTCCVSESNQECSRDLPQPVSVIVHTLMFPAKPIIDLLDDILKSPIFAPIRLLLSPIAVLLSMVLIPLRILRFIMYLPFYLATTPLRSLKEILNVVWNLISSLTSPTGSYLMFTVPLLLLLGPSQIMNALGGFIALTVKFVQNPAETTQVLSVFLPYILGRGPHVFEQGMNEFVNVMSSYSECV